MGSKEVEIHAEGFRMGWYKGVGCVFKFLSTKMTEQTVKEYEELYMAWELLDESAQDTKPSSLTERKK